MTNFEKEPKELNKPKKPKESNKPKKLEKLIRSEKEYLETHLKGMDEVKKRWYMNAMKTWTKEDYINYAKFYLWMFGIEEGKDETD